ncbi:MAG: hypothetical protein ACLPKT_17805 [Methylocella sp.]
MNPVPANRTCSGAVITMQVGISGRALLLLLQTILIPTPARGEPSGLIVTETLVATILTFASEDSQLAQAGT